VLLLAAVTAAIVVVAVLIAGAGADSEMRDDASAPTVTTAVPPPATIPSGALRLGIGDSPSGRPLPGGFLGLSIECTTLLAYAGSDPNALNPTFIQLLRNLNPDQSPSIRIGGDSTDWTWWPTPGVRRPPGVTYTLTPEWLGVAHATAAALGAHLLPGIQFEADSRRVAASEANAMVRTIGTKYLAGFELGNEPEVYAALGWYHTPAGVQVPGRRRGYDLAKYTSDFASVSRALPRNVAVAGPASGAPKWLAGVGSFLSANPRVKLATFHRYPLDHCAGSRSSPTYPTIANLLKPSSSAGLADSVAAAVRAAHARGRPLRVDELNSVSCRGTKGVSDTFASALWALDALFNLDRVGVDGVNVHTLVDSNYQPFTFTHDGGVWRAQVKPLYYGLLMFARAAPPGSRLLPTAGGPSSGPVRTWATRAPDGTVRAVVINDSRARTVAVAPPSGSTSATLMRLTAPTVRSTSGVTIGGQSFGSSTTTGSLPGAGRVTGLRRVAGRYVVVLPAASAAMLTFH
jgi:hypothetical protein